MPKIGLAGASKNAEHDPQNEQHQAVKAEAPPPASGDHDELDKLRGILFGNLQSDQEQALARLESRIAAQSTKIRGELDEIVRRIENRIEELDTRSSKDHDDLREQLLSQSNLLNDAIEERSAQVTELVTQGIKDLGHAKLDRQRFASFISSLKTHLDGEEAAPAFSATESASEAEPETREPAAAAGDAKASRKPWHPASAG